MRSFAICLHRALFTACLTASCLACPSPVMGADARADDLAQQLSEDLSDRRLDAFPLFEAAWIAGGMSDAAQLQQASNQFLAIGADDENIAHATGIRRAQAILHCLHRELLTGEYRPDYSELHRTLTDGHFNCVTATILFRCLCDRFHVDVHPASTMSHVFCVYRGDQLRLIETTCRVAHWPDAAHDHPATPLLATEKLREITDVELLGKVYYNRGVTELEQRHYASAVDLFQLARQLDPGDPAARDNLLAAINNWALAECDEQRYASAVELLEQGLSLDENYSPLLANDLHVHQRWVRQLCSQENFSQALQVLDKACQRRPDVELFRRGGVDVCRQWARTRFDQNLIGDLHENSSSPIKKEDLPPGGL